VKAVARRLCRLEQWIAAPVNVASQGAAELLRERRRRRLEADGQPDEELPWYPITLPAGRSLSIAEMLRLGRQLTHERNLARAATQAAGIATDIWT
jgi:hypothetical protein